MLELSNNSKGANMAFFTPDYLFRDIYEITPDFFKNLGVSFVFSDIDNTLVTYDDELPTPELYTWLDGMKSAGIEVAFVSNNHSGRVRKFNSELGYDYISRAGKPFTFKMKKLLKSKVISKSSIAVLGDQILTDTLSAKRIGALSVNVPPIKDRTGAFYRFKRKIESQLMKPFFRNSPELRELWLEKTGNRKKKGE